MEKANNNLNRERWLSRLASSGQIGWTKLGKDECLELRDCIITIPEVAEMFFRKTLIGVYMEILKEMSLNDKDGEIVRCIAAWVHTGMYDMGKWTRLKNYRGDCSFKSWIYMCVRQIVFNEFDRQRVVKKSSSLRLKKELLKSLGNSYERKMVIGLVKESQLRHILSCKYLKMMTDREIMGEMNMSEEQYKKSVRVAEKALVEALSEVQMLPYKRDDGKIVNLTTEVLGYRDARKQIYISDDESEKMLKSLPEDNDYDELNELLSELYPQVHSELRYRCFVLDRLDELELSETDETIFIERLLNNEAPKSLARRFDKSRSYIDSRYSQLRAKFKKYAAYWLARNGEMETVSARD